MARFNSRGVLFETPGNDEVPPSVRPYCWQAILILVLHDVCDPRETNAYHVLLDRHTKDDRARVKLTNGARTYVTVARSRNTAAHT